MTLAEQFNKIMETYLRSNGYIAWFIWHGNLEYLCTTGKKLVEHDTSFLSAWNAADAKGSYERTRIRLLGRKY